MWCSVNPSIREPEVDLLGATTVPRRVVVVGGGVAGSEAAYRAAERGSQVTLFEAGHIGGRAAEGRLPPRPGALGPLSRLAGEQLQHLASTSGSEPARRSRSWWRSNRTSHPRHRLDAAHPDWYAGAPTPVVDADQVVVDPPALPQPGGVALLVDEEGGFVAPTAAEALVEAGWKVRIATNLPHVAAAVDPTQVWWVRRPAQAGRGRAHRLGRACARPVELDTGGPRV